MARSKKKQSDPTGQAGNRRKATAALTLRVNSAQKKVRQLFRSIPKKRRTKAVIRNAESTVVYDYEVTDRDLTDLQNSVQFILNEELLESQSNMPPEWYWKDQIEPPYRRGTAEEINQFNQLLSSAVVGGAVVGGLTPQPVPVTDVLLSAPYQSGLNKAYTSNFQVIKTLSERTSAQVLQQVTSGIEAGQTPTAIAEAITERFNVAKSSAKRIANTEVNKAYNDAKMQATEVVSERTGLRAGVIHISALLPTTRPHHAARHGNVYTVEDQLQWWNTGSNRINCFHPDTIVQGRFKAGLKSRYSGNMVNLMTGDGINLTVTPNHKVMTDRGLVAAAEISIGDNLLAHSVQGENSIGVVDLDVHQTDARIDDVFTALSEVGHSRFIRPMSVDFNGDERFIDEDINAVLAKRSLIYGSDTEIFKALDYLKLIHANTTSIGFSSLFKRLKRIFHASSSFNSGIGKSFLFFFGHICRPIDLAFFSGSWFEASSFKAPHNDRPRNTDISRDLKNGLPASVKTDKVIDIKVSYFSGHVYDLQEESGLMIANGVIASNCHCTVEPVLLDSSGNVVQKEFQEEILAERSVFN